MTYRIKVNGQEVADTFDPNGTPCAPLVLRDTPGIRSPLDGSWVEGKSARKEHMKRHGVREVDPSERPNYQFKHPERQHLNKD
jgi:hypothetical protein